jgi:hypothetical protein
MRKIVVVLAGLLVLVIMGDGLYTAVARLDTKGDTVIRHMLQDPYDFAMPSIVIDPAPGYAQF